MNSMFNITEILNKIDNAAKESFEDNSTEELSATSIRRQRKGFNEDVAEEDENKSYRKEATVVSQESNSNHSSDDKLNEQDVDTRKSSSSEKISDNGAMKLIHDDTAKLLKKKDKEIERLNAECLELEESCNAVKKEVQEAWNSYKQAQERAAIREAELYDEISQLQKAKASDKQAASSTILALNEQITALNNKISAMEEFQKKVHDDMEHMQNREMKWKATEAKLIEELDEARVGSYQGAQDIRNQLYQSELQLESLRQEHSLILSQFQSRQRSLEEQNLELIQTITEKEKEFVKLQTQLQSAGIDEGSLKEIMTLKDQNSVLMKQLDIEKERNESLENKLKRSECEQRARVLVWEDERDRTKDLITSLETKVSVMEEQLKEAVTNSTKKNEGKYLRKKIKKVKKFIDSAQNDGHDNTTIEEDDDEEDDVSAEIRDLNEQIQQLSKQLLKKHSLVQELQADKAALKGRCSDLQARCARAEQQLSQLHDIDLENGFDDDDNQSGKSFSYGSIKKSESVLPQSTQGTGGMRRRKVEDSKVISDLEKLGYAIDFDVCKSSITCRYLVFEQVQA